MNTKFAKSIVCFLLVATGLTSIGLTAQPAEASEYKRTREGAHLWAPREGAVVQTGSSNFFGNLDFDFWFAWFDLSSRQRLTGFHRAMEQKLVLNGGAGLSGRILGGTTLPSCAGIVLDTPLSDSGSSPAIFGWTAQNANCLSFNSAQMVGVRGHHDFQGQNLINADLDWRASTYVAHDLSSCGNTTATCTFNDYTLRVARGGWGLKVAKTGSRVYHWNVRPPNHHFEVAGHWTGDPGNFTSRTCGGIGNTQGYVSPCSMRLSRGTSPYPWAGLHNKGIPVSSTTADNRTLEAAVLCVNTDTCGVALEMTFHYPFLANPVKRKTATTQISSDGRWYSCGLDFDHGFSSTVPPGFTSMDISIWTTGNSEIKVDAVLTAGYHDEITSTASDNYEPKPVAGQTCSRL